VGAAEQIFPAKCNFPPSSLWVFNTQLEELRCSAMLEKAKRSDKRIRAAIQGVTLAYNSSWGHTIKDGEQTQRIETTGTQALTDLLSGDTDLAFQVVLEIDIRWRIYVTIYNVTECGEEYIICLPVIDRDAPMIDIIHDLQMNIIPAAKKKRNESHILDWGYWGEICGN